MIGNRLEGPNGSIIRSMKSPRALLRLSLFVSTLLAAACGRGGDREGIETIRITAIPDQNTTELAEKYAVVADYLSEHLGVPFEYVPTVDYGASVELFRNGDVHLAWFGGLTGVQARAAVPGARAIAQGRNDSHFRSDFIVDTDTGIEPSESFPMALEGLSFTFGSPSSTSGRLMPEYWIRKETGNSPEEFFGNENHYSGSHDKTAKLVEAGTYDVGALNFLVYDRMVEEGNLDPARCAKVWTTPPYPDYNWTAHPILDERHGPGFIDRLQETLVSIEDPAVLEALQRPEGLIPARNEDYRPIEEVARDFGFLE